MKTNINKIKEEIDLIFKNKKCEKIERYINNAFLDLKDEMRYYDISDEAFNKLLISLKTFSLFIPILDRKEKISFYINGIDGNICIHCQNDRDDILNIVVENNKKIAYCCAKNKYISMHTGNLDIGTNNYNEIETLFLILNFKKGE